MSSEEVIACKAVMSDIFDSLYKYGEEYRGKPEGIMAYDVLLSAWEQADALGLDLKDIGLTKTAVDGLLRNKTI